MFRCNICDGLNEARWAMCRRCGAFGSVEWFATDNPSAPLPQRFRGPLISASELVKFDLESLPLPQEWRGRFGRLPQRHGILRFGPPGSMKTTDALLQAHALSRIAPVLFVAAEEGQGNAVVEKLQRLEIRSTNLYISSAVCVAEMLSDLERLPGCKFLFLDSIQAFSVSLIELSQIAERFGLGVSVTCHAVKDGALYRGPSDLAHWVDCIIRCENGTATLTKNRFGPLKNWKILAEEIANVPAD